MRNFTYCTNVVTWTFDCRYLSSISECFRGSSWADMKRAKRPIIILNWLLTSNRQISALIVVHLFFMFQCFLPHNSSYFHVLKSFVSSNVWFVVPETVVVVLPLISISNKSSIHQEDERGENNLLYWKLFAYYKRRDKWAPNRRNYKARWIYFNYVYLCAL